MTLGVYSSSRSGSASNIRNELIGQLKSKENPKNQSGTYISVEVALVLYIPMSESIYEYNKSRETSENTGQNRYNLNKNTSDTAGFKHCLLVCLVFFITGKRDLGYRGQTASRLYRHYSRLYNTLTRRRLC